MNEFDRQLEGAAGNTTGNGTTGYYDREFYEQFLRDISITGKGGGFPRRLGRDMKFLLDCRRSRLKKSGTEIWADYRPEFMSEPAGTVCTDGVYTGKSIFKAVRRHIRIKNKKGRKLDKKESISFYENIIFAGMEKIRDNDKFCCPYCGKVHGLRELEEGCPDCGIISFITELFPLVKSFFCRKIPYISLNVIGKTIALFCIAGFALGVPLGVVKMIFDMPMYLSQDNILGIVSGAFTAPFAGLVAGGVAAVIVVLLRLIYDNIRSSPLSSMNNETRKKVCGFMVPYDRNFSYDFFESRVLFLLELIFYCEDRDSCPYFDLKSPVRDFDIVDDVYRGAMKLRDIKSENGMCTAVLDVYMSDIHDSGDRIFSKDEVFRVTIEKNLSGFSRLYSEAGGMTCRKCGEGFDGMEKNGVCSSCGEENSLRDYDWVLIGCEIV
ncbi:MAG: hypothetical protein ACI4JB_01090 [Porcipelethomonas sp.]